MYHSRFFFYQLACSLRQELCGARLLECFSQQKDELLLHFLKENNDGFFMKADLASGVSILSFPEKPERSRSNSASLFPGITGSVVEEVQPEKTDRLFRLRFSSGLFLSFKMYGQRSNVLLHDETKVLAVFNNHLRKDLENLPQAQEPQPEEMQWHPDGEVLRKRCPGFTRHMWQYWEKCRLHTGPEDWPKAFRQMVNTLEKPGNMYLCRENQSVFLSFFPMAEVLQEGTDPIAFSNQYYRLFWQINRFFAEKNKRSEQLQFLRNGLHDQISVLEGKAIPALAGAAWRKQADLLMAYAHLVPRGAEKASLPDFDGSGQVEIPLKKDLSIPENAERLYRKARGQVSDMQRILKNLEDFRRRYKKIQEDLLLLEEVKTLKELHRHFPAEDRQPEEVIQSDQPFHLFTCMDYEIRVGKNAKGNDELLRISHKDDLWLHARDVTGSHVLVKTKKGKPTPQPVIRRAAELAAHYSKASREKMVPVMLTERKYVRKIKGSAAGLVKVEREKTLLAEPSS